MCLLQQFLDSLAFYTNPKVNTANSLQPIKKYLKLSVYGGKHVGEFREARASGILEPCSQVCARCI